MHIIPINSNTFFLNNSQPNQTPFLKTRTKFSHVYTKTHQILFWFGDWIIEEKSETFTWHMLRVLFFLFFCCVLWKYSCGLLDPIVEAPKFRIAFEI